MYTYIYIYTHTDVCVYIYIYIYIYINESLDLVTDTVVFARFVGGEFSFFHLLLY